MRPLLLLLTLFAASPAAAQLGIGGQLGTPTGLSLKFGQGSGSIALAVGWDLDESVGAEGHYLIRERRLRGSQADVRVFLGPGAFIQAIDNGPTEAGVSFGVGLSAFLTRELEAYGLVSPRLQLVEETDVDLGAGVGLRLYL